MLLISTRVRLQSSYVINEYVIEMMLLFQTRLCVVMSINCTPEA